MNLCRAEGFQGICRSPEADKAAVVAAVLEDDPEHSEIVPGPKWLVKLKLDDVLQDASLFARGSAEIKDVAYQTLAQVTPVLKEHPELGVEISCHCGADDGEPDEFARLSLQRAHAIRAALAEDGVGNPMACRSGGRVTDRVRGKRVELMPVDADKVAQLHEEVPPRGAAAGAPVDDQGVRIVFETRTTAEVTFTRTPLGIEFENTAPITIENVTAGGQGQALGIRRGWVIKSIDGKDCIDAPFKEQFDLLEQAASRLPDGNANARGG